MWAITVAEGVQAAAVTAVGAIIVAIITRFSRQNAKDHAVVQQKLDQLSDSLTDTHSTIVEVQADIKYLRKDHDRVEERLNRHLEEKK
jgi:uncharacterized membrane-anchored protein YhcB (DUF1043 family)